MKILDQQRIARSKDIDSRWNLRPTEVVSRVLFCRQLLREVARLHSLHAKIDRLVGIDEFLGERLYHSGRMTGASAITPHGVTGVVDLLLLAGNDVAQGFLGVRSDLHEKDAAAGFNNACHHFPSSRSSSEYSSSGALP